MLLLLFTYTTVVQYTYMAAWTNLLTNTCAYTSSCGSGSVHFGAILTLNFCCWLYCEPVFVNQESIITLAGRYDYPLTYRFTLLQNRFLGINSWLLKKGLQYKYGSALTVYLSLNVVDTCKRSSSLPRMLNTKLSWWNTL
jgi:hypothetical protein